MPPPHKMVRGDKKNYLPFAPPLPLAECLVARLSRNSLLEYLFRQLIIYRISHKGLDFTDEFMDFILSVFLYYGSGLLKY